MDQSSPQADQQQLRVVIVDDLARARAGLRAVLGREPHLRIVGEADNGRTGLDLAQLLRPDVVLMDVYMPEMDGLEATRRIKEWRPETRVVLLSIDATVQALALAAGADVCLLKGVPVAQLLAALGLAARAARS